MLVCNSAADVACRGWAVPVRQPGLSLHILTMGRECGPLGVCFSLKNRQVAAALLASGGQHSPHWHQGSWSHLHTSLQGSVGRQVPVGAVARKEGAGRLWWAAGKGGEVWARQAARLCWMAQPCGRECGGLLACSQAFHVYPSINMLVWCSFWVCPCFSLHCLGSMYFLSGGPL